MKKSILFLLILCLGCSRRPEPINVKVSLINGSRSLKISGFDKAVIADIGRDTNNEAWQSLLPVYTMPKDTDMKDYQNEQPGNYKVDDSLVIFTPDTAFKKGQTYFLRYFSHDEGTSALQYIRDRKRPGTLSYKDLVFSY
jgi:AraC-like DNA-binding protein